jgi:hypothetical protein
MEFYPPEELIGRFVPLRRYRLNDLPALKKAIQDSGQPRQPHGLDAVGQSLTDR